MKKLKFIIIDGNALLHRAWHALPPLTTNTGQLVNAVYGFTTIFLKVLKDLEPEYVAVTFDRREKTFRHEEFKDYKATRVKQPDELYEQIPILKNLLAAFNIKIFEKAGFEADDVIGSIANQAGSEVKTIIVTGDLDTLQLINNNIEVYTLKKGISDTFIYDEQAVKDRYGLVPKQMVDYKALRGDPSDNIPGVKGIGEKSACELIKNFGTLEKLYQQIKDDKWKMINDKLVSEINIDIKKSKIKERYLKLLLTHEKDAELSKKLSAIVTDVDVDFKLDDCRLKPYDRSEIVKIFQELNFKSLLTRLPQLQRENLSRQPSEPGIKAEDEKTTQGSLFQASGIRHQASGKEIPHNKNYHLVRTTNDFEVFFKKLKSQKTFAFDTETSSFDPLTSKLLGISFCWKDNEAHYISLINDQWSMIDGLRSIFENPQIKKIAQNAKFDLKVLHQAGIEVNNICFDTMIASYLLNPGTRGHGLDNLAFVEFGHQMITMEDLIGKGRDKIAITAVPTKDLAQYSCEDVDYTWRLKDQLEKKLQDSNNYGLLAKMEIPLIYVLAEMEENGVMIDSGFLAKMSQSIKRQLAVIEGKIYQFAGAKFNIRSPLQLKEILFQKLNLSTLGLGKTKTGVSTAADELDKLKGKHKIIDFILEHRELSKLLNTYIDALPKLINPKTGRVHTSYNQTITATGRLSSSDPNLQNIPIRTSLGSQIRQAFIAPRGYKIISADYSQIELRIVASLANDPIMISIFKGHQDIHTATAAFIHDLPEEQIDKQLRRTAKEINFGVLYGMGASGIAQRTGLTRAKAQEFLDKYYGRFRHVQQFLARTVELGRESGHVETLFGRVRYLPDLASGVQQIRAAAERMALNHPIQGTAADLIKLAMINIHSRINREFGQKELVRRLVHRSSGEGGSSKSEGGREVKILLQVHDELVFEVRDDLVNKVAKIIKQEMETVYELRVPIEVEIEVGQNWGALKPLSL